MYFDLPVLDRASLRLSRGNSGNIVHTSFRRGGSGNARSASMGPRAVENAMPGPCGANRTSPMGMPAGNIRHRPAGTGNRRPAFPRRCTKTVGATFKNEIPDTHRVSFIGRTFGTDRGKG